MTIPPYTAEQAVSSLPSPPTAHLFARGQLPQQYAEGVHVGLIAALGVLDHLMGRVASTARRNETLLPTEVFMHAAYAKSRPTQRAHLTTTTQRLSADFMTAGGTAREEGSTVWCVVYSNAPPGIDYSQAGRTYTAYVCRTIFESKTQRHNSTAHLLLLLSMVDFT